MEESERALLRDLTLNNDSTIAAVGLVSGAMARLILGVYLLLPSRAASWMATFEGSSMVDQG